MLKISVEYISSSERHLLSKVAPTLSLKMPCYGIFTFGFQRLRALSSAWSPSNPVTFLFRPNKKDCRSSPFYLVEVTGFEPATSSSRTKRATKLRHTSKKQPRCVSGPLAAELGFEPRHTESESAVLPLHNSALHFYYYSQKF